MKRLLPLIAVAAAAMATAVRADTVVVQYVGFAGDPVDYKLRQADGVWLGGGPAQNDWSQTYAGPYLFYMRNPQDTSGYDAQGGPDGHNEAVEYGWVSASDGTRQQWLYCIEICKYTVYADRVYDIRNVTSAPIDGTPTPDTITPAQAQQIGELWELFYADSVTPHGMFDYSGLFGAQWSSVDRRTVGDALNAAIWETAFETKDSSGGYTYDVLAMSGAPVDGVNTGFALNGATHRFDDSSTATFQYPADLANAMLAYVDSRDLKSHPLKALTNGAYQDQVFEVVPEPHAYVSLIGLGLAVAGLFGLQRLRRSPAAQ